MKKLSLLLLFALLGLLTFSVKTSTITTFHMVEREGVSHPEEIFEADFTTAFDPRTSKLIGPNGTTEVVYQRLYQKVAFQARLPASTVNTLYYYGPVVSATNDTISWSIPRYGPPVNTLLSFQASDNTCGLTSGTTYFVYDYNYYINSGANQQDNAISFKSTLAGSKINLSAGCAAAQVTWTGFISDGSTDVITAPNHQRQNGDPIRFVGTGGACPSGLTCNGTAVYYIVSATSDTFKVSTSVGGSAVDIGTVTGGVNQLITDWTWTLVDTGAPTAVATNPVVIDESNSGYIQVTNSLTGYRGLKLPSFNTYSVGGGTLTNCVVATVVSRDITCTFPNDINTVMGPGSTVTINGSTDSFGPTGTWTVTSNPTTKKIYIVTGSVDINDTTYNNSDLTVIAGDLSWNPIQGIRLADGTWVGTGKHIQMSSSSGTDGSEFAGENNLKANASLNRSYTRKFTEAGPLKTVLQTTYSGYEPVITKSLVPIPGSVLLPCTTATNCGTYTVTMTLLANSKLPTFEVSGTYNYGNFLEVYSQFPGTVPNTWEYRTRVIPSAGCGVYGPFTITNASNTNPIVITTSTPHGMVKAPDWTATITGVGGNTAANGTFAVTPIDRYTFSIPVSGNGSYTSGGTVTDATATDYQDRMSTLHLPIDYSINTIVGTCNTGIRQELGIWNFSNPGGVEQAVYYSGASAGDPILGLTSGKASAQVLDVDSAVGFYSSNNLFGGTALGIVAVLAPCDRCTSGSIAFSTTTKRQFAVYAGTMADIASLGSPQDVSAMTRERNKVTGINLTSIYKYQLEFSDPPAGWKYPFMADASVATVKSNYLADSPAGYHAKLRSSVGNEGTPTLDVWDGASITTTVITPLIGITQSFTYSLIYGDGVQDPCCAYVQNTLTTGPAAVTISNMLPESGITTTEKAILKAYAAYFGSQLWDTDFTPQWDGTRFVSGEGGGTSNQDQQYQATKYRYVSAFPTQPYLAQQAATFVSSTTANINQGIASTGSCSAPPHYCSAVLTDTFFSILSQVKAGTFSLSNIPQLINWTGWHRNMLTPKDVRFGGTRMAPSLGDGDIEPEGLAGMPATMYVGVDSTVSQRSIADFFAQETATIIPYTNFFGTTLTAIDPTITNPGLPTLSTVNYPGCYSSLRFGSGTSAEHWALISDGSFCGDHGHQDRGAISQGYFHTVPFIIDPSSDVYSPHLSGSYYHSTLVQDSDMPVAWNATMTSTELPATYGTPVQTELVAGTKVSYAVQTNTRTDDSTVWTRAVTLVNANSAYPILRTKDSRSGTSGTAAAAIAWWLQATGAVSTPDGSLTPTTKQTTCTGTPSQYPSSFSSHAISSGLQHWSFTGFLWPFLSTGGHGIDADAYYIRGDPGDAYGLSQYQYPCTQAVGGYYQTANTTAITSFVRVDDTHATIVTPSFYFVAGQTATVSGVVGTAMTGQSPAVTVDSVSGTTATISGLPCCLTGSYTVVSAQVVPDYIEASTIWRIHGTGDFVTAIMPYLKNAAPTRTVTSPSGNALRSVQGSETTNDSDTQTDWTDGTAKLLFSKDANSHTFSGLNVTGGTQEVYCATSASCVWTITGFTAGTRCFDPGVTMYADAPVTNPSGTQHCRYHPGSVSGQPAVYTVNLSTTPGTQSSVAIQSYSASGNLYLKAGSEFVGTVASSGAATITTVTPSSHSAFSLCSDASGSLVCEN